MYTVSKRDCCLIKMALNLPSLLFSIKYNAIKILNKFLRDKGYTRTGIKVCSLIKVLFKNKKAHHDAMKLTQLDKKNKNKNLTRKINSLIYSRKVHSSSAANLLRRYVFMN